MKTNLKAPLGYPVSPSKFWILSILALNLFPFYWGYKTFLTFDPTPAKRPRVFAVINGLFLFARLHKLMTYIEKTSVDIGTPVRFPKLFYAIAMFILFWLAVGFATTAKMHFLMVIPHALEMLIVFQIQQAILKLNRKLEPQMRSDTGITVNNAVAIACSILVTIIGPDRLWQPIENLVPEYEKPSKRWAFIPAENNSESFQKGLTLKRIDHFWKKFQEEQTALDPAKGISNISQKSEKFMEKNLLWIDSDLEWELSLDHFNPKKSAFTVSTSKTEVMPIVKTLIQEAPKLPNWNFYSYFQPFPPERIKDELHNRYDKNITTFSTVCKLNNFNQIDVEVSSPDFKGKSKKENEDLALDLCYLTLGQEQVSKWLGVITTKTSDPKKPVNFAAAEFAKDFAKAKQQAISRLPSKPYFMLEPKTRWNFFYSQNEKNIPKEAFLDIDAFKSGSFYSERFSRNGEVFCLLYAIKSSKTDVNEMEKTAERLNSLLVENKCGATLALGEISNSEQTIYLCLSDLTKAIKTIRKFCRQEKFEKESWIIFIDTDKIHEWIGIYDDSPSPYKEEETEADD